MLMVPTQVLAADETSQPQMVQTLAADGTPPPQPQQAAAALETQVQLAAQALLEASGGTSMRYALIEDGELTLSGGAGEFSREQGALPGADTLYGIGSISKMYTTAAVMQLVEAGKVDLDAPVTDYIPDFTMADVRYQQITVRMLLNHSAGLYGTDFHNTELFDGTGTEGKDQLLASLAGQVLKADPGAYSTYTNDGFTLAEILVERVSGQSFTDYISEHMLTPLQLTNTFTPVNIGTEKVRLAKDYYGTQPQALPDETLTVIGAGGIYATAEDVARWGEVFYKGTLLTEQSRTAMQEPEYKRGFWPEEQTTYAYGLGFDSVSFTPFAEAGVTALFKGGGTNHYQSGLIVLPELKMSVAVVGAGGSGIETAMIASTILSAKLAERGIDLDLAPTFPAAQVAKPSQAEVAKAGKYVGQEDIYDISITDQGILTVSDQPEMQLTYHDDGSYRDAAGTTAVKLVERDGETYLFQQQYILIPGLAPLYMGDYIAHKLPANPVSVAATAAWMEHDGREFVLLNEPYNSLLYLGAPAVRTLSVDPVNNYVLTNKIVDATTATPVVQLPGDEGRDWNDLTLSTTDGITYLTTGGFRLARTDALKPIIRSGTAPATIADDGYARWYTAGEAAGKRMTVTSPAQGNFYVYDEANNVVASSLFGDTGTGVLLPAGGKIAFIAPAGSQFQVTVKAAPASA
jgi:CubicO group peptidase (beta-lactamase class C family)